MFMVHVRGLAYISVLLLATNLLIAVALVGMLKDRLWVTGRAPYPQDNEATCQPAAAGLAP